MFLLLEVSECQVGESLLQPLLSLRERPLNTKQTRQSSLVILTRTNLCLCEGLLGGWQLLRLSGGGGQPGLQLSQLLHDK